MAGSWFVDYREYEYGGGYAVVIEGTEDEPGEVVAEFYGKTENEARRMAALFVDAIRIVPA